jgi:lysophospholipase L1-like esterase
LSAPRTIAALCAVLAVACGADKQTGEDAGATAAAKDSPADQGRAWKPGDPIVRVEGGELLDDGDPAGGPIRVGVIGDSITQGGVFDHRYPKTLQKLLGASFPGSIAEAYGVPGETCEKLEARFGGEILARRPAYHFAIVQCGTNDLHNGLTTARVERSLERMIALAQGAGLRVIVLTVGPLWGHPGWTEEKEARRLELNGWILDRGGIVAVDVATPLSEGAPAELKAEFVHVDHVHPNRQGLDEMARAIFQAAFATGWQSVGPYIRYREEE